MRITGKVICFCLIPAVCSLLSCQKQEPVKPATEQVATTGATSGAQMIKTPSGLQYQDLVPGSGPSPVAGKNVTVHYTGWLTNGTKFDSSLDNNQPFTFTIGAGQVIPGWDEGVMSMKLGGKRKMVIPPQLGYGTAGAGGVIPPDATLVFEVLLLDIR